MKITSNLIKEITFNPTVNKFEYLEQLLAQEYKEFNSKVNELSVKQVIISILCSRGIL